ncbi:MAG: hypothetical protein LBS45_08340 [Synergistaceae bacterium]|jgi:hypothetical protein|nr:hypothetical protein [Synergistaceae bacterium]
MKRKILFVMLLGILLIGYGLSARTAALGAQDSGVVREFGETDAILDAGDTFICVLRFPKTGIAEADRAIYDWARTAYAVVKGHADGTDSEGRQNEAVLDVGYSAFLVKGDYAGIEETGDLSGSFLAHPIDIVRTFNIDIKGKRLLTADEILNNDRGLALALLRRKIAKRYPDMQGKLRDAGETWLEHLVIKRDGVEILLPRGEFLPSHLGLERFLLTYEELGGFLTARNS